MSPAGTSLWLIRILIRQGFDELADQIEARLLMLSCLIIVLHVRGVRGYNDYHVEVIQQDDQLSAMPCGVVQMMVAYPGGPPLIAVPDVAKVTADSTGSGRAGIRVLRIGLQ